MRIRLQAPDLQELGQRLLDFERAVGSPDALLKRWAVIVEQHIKQNFIDGGHPRWAPLTNWTRAGRRAGTGGDSARPLVDTGRLRDSFDSSIQGRKLTVFSNDPRAVWHEFGVKPRAEIRPKHGKALALPALVGGFLPGGLQGPAVKGQFSLGGLGRSRAARPGSRTVIFNPLGAVPKRLAGRIGKTVVPYKDIIFRSVIRNWPGIPARPMLPRAADIVPALTRIAQRELLRVLFTKAARG